MSINFNLHIIFPIRRIYPRDNNISYQRLTMGRRFRKTRNAAHLLKCGKPNANTYGHPGSNRWFQSMPYRIDIDVWGLWTHITYAIKAMLNDGIIIIKKEENI